MERITHVKHLTFTLPQGTVNKTLSQIKAMRFILASKFLIPDTTRQAVEKYGSSGSVSISNVDAYASGKKKVEDNFNRKLFSLFGVLNLDEEEGRDSD